MKIGYTRTSTDEQNQALQIDALRAAGCEKVFSDVGVSGSISPHRRPGFAAAIDSVQAGDTFTVWKLDRLGRSLGDLIGLLKEFEGLGIEFQSLTDGIDTTTGGGKLVFHIIGALAEFERSLIAERTREGMRAAKRRGKSVGRPKALTTAQVTHARSAIVAGSETIQGMADLFGVDRKTLSRALKTAPHDRARGRAYG